MREQSEIAKRYLLLRDELRGKEISVWLATLDKLRAQSESVRQEYEQLSAELERRKSELEAVYVSGDSLSERMHQKDIESEQARERLSAAEARLASCDAEAAVLKANIESSIENARRIEEDLEQQRGRIEEIRAEIANGEARLQEIDGEKTTLLEKRKSAENVLNGCRMKLESRENMLKRQAEALRTAELDCGSVEARVRILTGSLTVMMTHMSALLKMIHTPEALTGAVSAYLRIILISLLRLWKSVKGLMLS